jgi:hypothetical protein
VLGSPNEVLGQGTDDAIELHNRERLPIRTRAYQVLQTAGEWPEVMHADEVDKSGINATALG